MKQTKENLIVELTKIRQSHGEWVSGDERKRKEFAKAFNWYETTNTYGYSSQGTVLKLPSWEEIFVELGKVLAARSFMDFEGKLSELQCRLEDLENKIKKEIHPNL